MNKSDLEILKNMLPAGRDGRTPEPPEYAVRLLEEVCASTGLDWKKRHVYLMSRGGKWQVTLSIDGFRMVAANNPDYGGQEGPFYTMGPEKEWSDIPPEKAPYAAKVGIKHKTGHTTWATAKFSDYKAGPMRDKFPSTMTAKCAEMLALRKAMPDKLGGLYGIEEMAQGHTQAKEVLEKGTTEVKVPSYSPKDVFSTRLKMAQTLDEVKAIGAEIQKSEVLELEDQLALHDVYKTMKDRFVNQ